jgi:hypothetical protein
MGEKRDSRDTLSTNVCVGSMAASVHGMAYPDVPALAGDVRNQAFGR